MPCVSYSFSDSDSFFSVASFLSFQSNRRVLNQNRKQKTRLSCFFRQVEVQINKTKVDTKIVQTRYL